MGKRDDEPASRPDDESPEWTAASVKTARPALDVVSEGFGAHVADGLRRGRGRPAKSDRKVNQTLRLDADVLEAYRRSGKGWQTRINQLLREHMPGEQER
ncbi:MAG: BrnA antitoxin family protein [Alphaproteobacteria bacterium]